MKKRILIMSGASDSENKKDDEYNFYNLLNLTLKSKIDYANKHNYDLMIIRDFGVDYKNKLQRTDSNIGFLRALRVFEEIENYDTIMWVDGDSIITNPEYKIEDFQIDENTTFYASWDWMHTSPYISANYVHYFSLGNFIINKTKFLENFIKVFYDHAKFFPEEQFTINTLYHYTDLKNTIKILDHKFLGAVPIQIEKIWNDHKKLINPWDEQCFLAHFTGIPNKDRINIIKQDFSKYI
jgi:hypothetical protein